MGKLDPASGPGRAPLLALRLTQREIDALDAAAAQCGLTRSAVLRQALGLYLVALEDKEVAAKAS